MSQQYPGSDRAPQAFPGATQYDPAAPQPNYAAPTPYGFDVRPEHPDSTLVLTLGVVSLFTAVTGPFAWYYGSRARRQMEADPYRWSHGSGLTVGWVLGIITTVGLAVGVALLVIGAILITLIAVTNR